MGQWPEVHSHIMTTKAIKSDLIQWITQLDDKGLLQALLNFKSGTATGNVSDDLSIEARASIERGLKDIKEGRTVSSKDFWARYGR